MKLSQIVTESFKPFKFHMGNIPGPGRGKSLDHGWDVLITHYAESEEPHYPPEIEFELYHDQDSPQAGQRAQDVEQRLSPSQVDEIAVAASENHPNNEYDDMRDDYINQQVKDDKAERESRLARS